MLNFALFLLAGGALLYLGAEWLVKGSAGLARSFGVAPIVVGLTVVAYGTSAPELVVTLIAAAEGRSAIALGNVVGSNIANIGLILGLTAVIRPPHVEGTLIGRELPVMVAASAAVPLAIWNGVVSRAEGGLLLLGAAAFTWATLRLTRRIAPDSVLGAEAGEEVAQEAGKGSREKLAVLCALGLAALVGGGKLFVDGASGLALALGVSERFVGLTVVAVGTSLPELAASVVAALRRHAELAVGNIVGSNIFNIVFVLGGAGLLRPIADPFAANVLQLGMMLGMTVAGVVMLRSGRVVSRREGIMLLVAYAACLAVLAGA